MAPARMIPWMELAADIRGVCSVAGTWLMTSKPTQRLSTKIAKSVRSNGRSFQLTRRQAMGLQQARRRPGAGRSLARRIAGFGRLAGLSLQAAAPLAQRARTWRAAFP